MVLRNVAELYHALAQSDVEDPRLDRACRALCESGRFETGEGTCAPVCMEQLGDARAGPHGCPRRRDVHGALARAVLDAAGWD